MMIIRGLVLRQATLLMARLSIYIYVLSSLLRQLLGRRFQKHVFNEAGMVGFQGSLLALSVLHLVF